MFIDMHTKLFETDKIRDRTSLESCMKTNAFLRKYYK